MDLDPKTQITLAAAIAQGLLASGHYTQPNPKGMGIKHLIRRWAPGEDWQAEGHWCSQPSYVVEDALILLWELNAALTAGVQPATMAELTRKKPKKAVGKKR